MKHILYDLHHKNEGGRRYMRYVFQFKLFGENVRMFRERQMGIVIEKEKDVVCVYGTDDKHQNILCAIPLCHPKFLKKAEYVVDFQENDRVMISVGNLQIAIDFKNGKCATDKKIRCYGSDLWGQDVQVDWNDIVAE